MKTKTMSALLRAVLLAAGLLLVVFFFLFLPFYGQDTVAMPRNLPGPIGRV